MRYARVLTATAVAAVAGAALNTGVRSAAIALFDIPQPQFEPLNLGAVVVSSIVGAGAGGTLFAALTRLTRRPTRAFVPIAGSVLALSMIPVVLVNAADPPRYEGAGVPAGATLAVMHVVVAVVLIAALRAFADEATR